MSNVHEFTLFQKDKKMQKITAKDSGILAIGNSKGGVGKSTFSVHCAFFFAEKGYKVALIDLDNQGNSSKHLLKYNKDAKQKISITTRNTTLFNLRVWRTK